MTTHNLLPASPVSRLLFRLIWGILLVASRGTVATAQPFPPQYYAPRPAAPGPVIPPQYAPQQFPQQQFPPQQFVPQRGNPVIPPPYSASRAATTAIPISAGPNLQKVSTQDSIQELALRHPLCFMIGERLASQFISTETVEEGPFQEIIMGAKVQGTQRTNARTSIDFVPNSSNMLMKVVLNGFTVNQTLSQVRQASIQSAGSVEFQVTKQIEFDGSILRTWTPAAYMTIRQQNLGASTPVSPIPLLGPLASSIVMSAAEQQKPMTEAIAAQRITQAVAPEFNNRLDTELIKLNQKLNGQVKDWLDQSQLMPTHISTRSTDNAGMWGVAFEPATASGTATIQSISTGGRRNRAVPSRLLLPVSNGTSSDSAPSSPFEMESQDIDNRLVGLIHQSLIADLAERYELSGKEVPPSLLNRFLSGGAAEPEGPSLGNLVLDREQPITATITRGEFLLTIRAGFKPVIGPEIPAQEVVFSFRPMLTQTDVVLKPELVSISQINPGTGGFLAAAGEGIVRQAIQQKLQDYTFPRNISVPRESGKDPLPLRLQSLTLADGWMSIVYESEVKSQRPAWQSSDASMEEALLK